MDGSLALREEKFPPSNVPLSLFFFTRPATPLSELQLGHQMWRKKGVCLTIHLTLYQQRKKKVKVSLVTFFLGQY
jgi:hypothetical protein